MSYKSESASRLWCATAGLCWRSRVWSGCRQRGEAMRSAVATLCRRVGLLPGDDYIALPLLAASLLIQCTWWPLGHDTWETSGAQTYLFPLDFIFCLPVKFAFSSLKNVLSQLTSCHTASFYTLLCLCLIYTDLGRANGLFFRWFTDVPPPPWRFRERRSFGIWDRNVVQICVLFRFFRLTPFSLLSPLYKVCTYYQW
jgi:hypothetical protein